jgi:hypothetical protein
VRQARRHREELGHFVLPVDAVHDRCFVLATDRDRAEVAVAHFAFLQLLDHGFGHPDLSGAGQIAEPRCEVDGVAVAIAIHLHHIAACDADLQIHAQGHRPRLEALLMVTLKFQYGRRRGVSRCKDGENTIAQHFDDAPTVRFANAADPLRQPRDRVGRARIAHRLENTSAPCQVREDDR